MKVKRLAFGCAVLVGAMLLTSAANAQYESDFEDLDASPAGVAITGQDGFYIPAGTDSVDAFVFTYLDNGYGIVPNPEGGLQFVAGEGPGSPTFSRAQRDIPWGTGIWEVEYDTLALYMGAPPSANNLGSFSVQPYPGSAGYIHLFSWVDIAAPTNWNAFYLAFDAAGVAHAQPGMSPGPMWENLVLNSWYRFETTIDFDQNKIIQVRITDMATGMSGCHIPTDWYLEGGEAGGSPTPTGFRFFAGGGVPGNVVAWDNLAIEPDMDDCPEDVVEDGVVDILDLLAVLAAWGMPSPDADVNDDCTVDILDLLAVLAAWGPC